MMHHFDFVWAGVRFKGSMRWRFVTMVRYSGSGRATVREWRGFRSYDQMQTARHVFLRTAAAFTAADVYVVDAIAGTVVAHAHRTEVLFECIDPLHEYIAPGGEG